MNKSNANQFFVLYLMFFMAHLSKFTVHAKSLDTVSIGNITCLHRSLHGDLVYTLDKESKLFGTPVFKIRLTKINESENDFLVDIDDHFVLRNQCPGVGQCITLNANIEIVKNNTQTVESKQSKDVQFCQGRENSIKQNINLKDEDLDIEVDQTQSQLVIKVALSNTKSLADNLKNFKLKLFVAKIEYSNYTETPWKANGIFKTKQLSENECVTVSFRVGYVTNVLTNDAKVYYSNWSSKEKHCLAMPIIISDDSLGTVIISNITCLHGHLHGDLVYELQKNALRLGVLYFNIRITKGNQTNEEVLLDNDHHFVLRKQCPGVAECVTLSSRIEIINSINQKYESKQSKDVKFCQGKQNNPKRQKIPHSGNIKSTTKMLHVQIKREPDNKHLILVVKSNSSYPKNRKFWSHFFMGKIEYKNSTKTVMKSYGVFKTERLAKDECVFATFRIGYMTSGEKKNDAQVQYSDWGKRKAYCNTIKDPIEVKYSNERKILHLVLSCIIPLLIIVALMVWAFISHYRNRGLDDEFRISIQSIEERLLGSGSSGIASPQNHKGGGGHSTLLLTEQAPKKKGGDDKLYSSNDDELEKILSCSGTDSDNRDMMKKNTGGAE